MNVAFLGLGTMGSAMAANVLRRGHSLVVWNRTAARAEALVAAGARWAPTPAEAARGQDVVITMLADVPAVETVMGGSQGVVEGLSPGMVVMDMSTVDPSTALKMERWVTTRGAVFMDAPVSGSRKPATDGTLLIMVGGPAEAVERVRPVLECMGRVVVVGGVGQGMAMKLVLNGLGAHMMAGLCSMLVLGRKLGLGTAEMLEVIGGGAFSSPMFKAKGDKIARRDFTADFSLALLRKDQRLVQQAARGLGYPMPTQDTVLDVVDEAVQSGLGSQDMCALIRLFEQWTGVADS